MKRLNVRFLGNLLIALGLLLCLAAVYDALRPYFPDRASYDFIGRLGAGLGISPTRRPAADRPDAPPPARRRRPPPRPETPPPLIEGEGLITRHVHYTRGGYHLWAWAVKPEAVEGERAILEAAHAAPGEEGGFWLVTFADTTGDGEPDREIARSDYLTAEKAGEWSALEFELPEDQRIFVGTTWPEGSATAVFRTNGPWPTDDGPFEDRFYHTIRPDRTVTAGPAYTNLRISFH